MLDVIECVGKSLSTGSLSHSSQCEELYLLYVLQVLFCCMDGHGRDGDQVSGNENVVVVHCPE